MKSTPLDCNKKFVRVTALRNQQFVEFDFAVGEPGLFIEMILPLAGFEAFCRDNGVTELDEAACALVDADKLRWRVGEGTGLSQR
jgi:phenol hydroxylase P0 protein